MRTSAKPQQNKDGQERRERRARHGKGMVGRGIILKAFLLIPLPNFLELGCGWPRCVFAPLR
jgi:hypothetical protein